MSARPVYLGASAAATACGLGGMPPLSAAMVGLTAACSHPLVCQPDGRGAMKPTLHAPVQALAPLPAAQRVEQLLRDALDDIAPAVARMPDARRVVLVLTPDQRCWLETAGQMEQVLSEVVHDCLARAGARAPAVTIRRARMPEVLTHAIAEIASRQVDSVLVISADSLLDSEDLGLMAENGILRTVTEDGVVPGECAAAVLLSSEPGEHPPLRVHAASRRADGAGEAVAEGAAPAVAGSIRAAGMTCDDIAALFLDADAGAEGDLQWWRIRQQLWPARLPEETREAVEVGAVDAADPESNAPSRLAAAAAIGACGEAALPLLLAMADAWMRQQRRWESFRLGEETSTVVVCTARREQLPWAACLTSERTSGRE